MSEPAPRAEPPPESATKQQWRDWWRARESQREGDEDFERYRRAANEAVEERLAEFLAPMLEPLSVSGRMGSGGAELGGEAGRPPLFLFYRALAHEVPLEPLADRLGWHHFVTTRTPSSGGAGGRTGGGLTIHPATGPMEQHRFGFFQPTAEAMEIPPEAVTVALVPGLLFDESGNRLGHGQGYYDELLARLAPSCLRIGVCLSRDVVDSLPTDVHDEAMTHLASENGVAGDPSEA